MTPAEKIINTILDKYWEHLEMVPPLERQMMVINILANLLLDRDSMIEYYQKRLKGK